MPITLLTSNPTTMTTYSPAELSKIAGVTVRTLHHYDNLGLLTPLREPEHGWRRYDIRDLLRLQQIQTLQWMGLSLEDIRTVIEQPTYDVRGALMLQKGAVEHEISRLQQVVGAIDELVDTLSEEGMDYLTPETIGMVIRAVQPGTHEALMRAHYGEEAWRKILQRSMTADPTIVEAGERGWEEVFADLEHYKHLSPEHPTLQAIGARMDALIQAFTGGDPEVLAGLRNLYGSGVMDYSPLIQVDREIWNLMQRVQEVYFARKAEGEGQHGYDPLKSPT